MSVAETVFRLRWRVWLVRGVAGVAALFALVGIVGCVLAYRQVDAVAAATQAQVRTLSRTTAQAAASVRAASTATTGAADTTDTTRAALTSAMQTVNESAATIDKIADSINFTIPLTNTRPLAGVDQLFRSQAGQLREIERDLGAPRDALVRNGDDLRRVGTETAALAAQTDTVARDLARYADDSVSGVPAAAQAARLALIWVALLHGMLLLLSGAVALLSLDSPCPLPRPVSRAMPPGAPIDAPAVPAKMVDTKTAEDAGTTTFPPMPPAPAVRQHDRESPPSIPPS